MKSMWEKMWEWGTKSAREMWVSIKCQCQASFKHEWETMRPGGVWMVWERTYKCVRHKHTSTHTLPTEPEPVPVRQVYGSIEGTGKEVSLSVELMKPAPTSIKEWGELAVRSFTHSLTSFLYTAPDEVMLSLLKRHYEWCTLTCSLHVVSTMMC